MNNELKEKIISSLNNKLLDDVILYCKVNDIEVDDIPVWFYKLVEDAFMVKKYGASPFSVEKPSTNIESNKEDKTVVIDDTIKSIETSITEEVTLVENKKKRRTLKTK